jgi:glucosamine--fructose-6-phosphate aminotransferase (isomerizing)
MMAIKIGLEKKTLSISEYNRFLGELVLIPEKAKTVLGTHEVIKKVDIHYAEARNFLFWGRGYNFPVA